MSRLARFLLRRGGPVTGASPAPAIEITADNATVSITPDGSVAIVVTLNRLNGFADTVTLATSGLPAGVTASYPSGNTYTGGTTQRTVLLTGSSASLVTADAFTISATGTDVSDQIDGTVSVVAAPSFGANAGAGLTLVQDTLFPAGSVGVGSLGTAGLVAEEGAIGGEIPSGGSGAIISDPVGGAPGATVFATRYVGGSTGDGAGGCRIIDAQSFAYAKLGVAMMIYVPSNYSIHSNGEKFLYLFKSGAGGAVQLLLQWLLEGSETPSGSTFGMEFTHDLSSYDNWKFFNVGSLRVPKDEWFQMEARFERNNPAGTANGIIRVWINGTLCMQHTNINYSAGSGTLATIDGIRFDGTRGGGASSEETPPEGQERLYGRLAWYAEAA